MFPKLSKRIRRLTMLSVFISMQIVSLSLYYFEKSLIKENFIETSLSYFESANNNVIYYLNYVKENGKMILNTSFVSNLMSGEEFVPGADSILGNLMSTNITSQSIAIFTNNGYKYTYQKQYSTAMSGIIEDNDLRNHIIDDSSYKFKYIKDKYGENFLLILRSVEDNFNTKGTMILGLNLSEILKAYDCEQTIYKNSRIYSLVDNENVEEIYYNNKNNREELAAKYLKIVKNSDNGSFLTDDNKALIVYNSIPDSNMKMVVSIPMSTINPKLNLLIGVNIAIVVVGCLLCFWMTVRLDKSIVDPLSLLYDKMKSFLK